MPRMKSVLAVLLLATAAFAAEPTVPASEYAARRARVAEAMGPKSMLILRSAEPARRNGDVDYPYRQDDNLYYLTGIDEPDTTLVLLPGQGELSEVLFVRDPNPRAELYTGRIPTHEEVKAKSGVRAVASAFRFDQFVSAALQGFPFSTSMGEMRPSGPAVPAFSDAVFRGEATVWLMLDRRPGMNAELTPALEYASKLRERFPEVRIRDVRSVLHEAREVKSDAEVALLRRAIDITTEAQKAAMRRALTATNEREIHATVDATFIGHGSTWGFPTIAAAGPNSTTLHYEANNAPVPRDAMILTDIGADVEGYSADVTRTYPADGTFSPEQRALYDAVYRAQEAVFRHARPGVLWSDLQDHATRSLGEDLLRLGLITKNDPAQVRLYFRHGLGHPIGLQVHDMARPTRPLEPGNVMAVEPGLYVRKADIVASPAFKALSAEEQKKVSAAIDRYADIGVRIEDDILITRDGYELLSGAAPRAAADIEKWMAATPSR